MSAELVALPPAARRALVYVLRHEGAHFREVQRAAGLATGQADHHLRRLERAGLLARMEMGHEVHYFPPTRPPADRPALAALRHPARAALGRVLLERSPASLAALAGALRVPESTLLHHLRVLASAGVVYAHRRGRRVAWGLSDPSQLRRLLERPTAG